MNEPTGSNPSETVEDRRLLAELDRLAVGQGDLAAELEPELLETWGRLPLALDPVEPAPAVRARVLAAARGEIASVAGERPGARRFDGLLAVAAMLLLALIGFAAWQHNRLEEQGRLIEELVGDLAASGNVAVRLGQTQRLLGEQQQRIAMVTKPGAEFCRLKPAGDAPTAKRSGMVVVAPDRQSSYFRVEGLAPGGGQEVYRVWFHTPDGPVAGPAFRVVSVDQPTELRGGAVPEGVREISITRERTDQGARPEGPRLLYADEAMRIF